MHPFDGILARLRVANNQINMLNAGLNTLFTEHPHDVAIEKNNQTGKCEVVLRNVPAIPIEFAIAAGLVAHGLRSALDGLACLLAFKNHCDTRGAGDFSTVCENVMFPIRIYGPDDTVPKGGPKHERRFSWESGNFKPIGKKYLTIIERMQPYHFGDDKRKRVLWILNCLNNTDKHRVLVIFALASARVSGVISVSGPMVDLGGGKFQTASPVPHKIFGGVPFVNGAKVAEFDTGSPDDLDVNIVVTPSVRFGKGCEAAEGIGVISTLRKICDQVSEIIESFAPEFGGMPSHNTSPSTEKG